METHETYNKKFDLLVKKHKNLCPLLWFHTSNQTANEKRFCCVSKPIHKKMNGEKYDENKKLSMTDHWNSAEHHHASWSPCSLRVLSKVRTRQISSTSGLGQTASGDEILNTP